MASGAIGRGTRTAAVVGAGLVALASWAIACGGTGDDGVFQNTGSGAAGTGGLGVGGNGQGGIGVGSCGACPGNQVCDATLGCVDCASNADCSSPGQPICVLGSCEECGAKADCGAAQTCQPTTHTCDQACTNNGNCDQGQANLCDTANGVCVECLTPADCANAPLCNTALGICANCITDGDCGVAAPVCNVPQGQCVQCLVTPDCNAGFTCNGHECVPICTTNADCQDNQVCDVPSGNCVQCLGNSDCNSGDQPLCSAGHQCVECLGNSDCNNGDQPLCSPQGNCVQCLTSADCNNNEQCNGFQCNGG